MPYPPLVVRALAILGFLRRQPFDTTTAQGRSYERYRRIALTTVANVVARLVSVAVGLVAVPLTLAYLGKEQYGLWTTITAFVAWAGLFDFGLLNGLLNRVAESDGRNDREAARTFVTSALAILVAIALGLLVATFLALPIVPWRSVFAAPSKFPDLELGWSVAAALSCIAIGMPLSVVRQVYAGYQRAYVGSIFAIFGALTMIAGLLVAVRLRASLPVIVLVFSGSGVVASIANLAFMLGREMPWLRPSLGTVSRAAIRRLMSTSTPMFLFQLGSLLINESQALVLAHRVGLDVVADYSIVWRVYILLVGFITVATTSFLPAFREAHERGESSWAALSFRRMLILRMALTLAASIALVFMGNLLLRIWLRRADVQFGPHVWIAVALLCVVAVWTTSFVDVLNIMDHVWPQVAIVIAQGTATVLLTFALAERGVFGALLANVLPPIVFTSWVLPKIARRFLAASGAGSAPSCEDRARP